MDELETRRSRIVLAFSKVLALDPKDFEHNSVYQAAKAIEFRRINEVIMEELRASRSEGEASSRLADLEAGLGRLSRAAGQMWAAAQAVADGLENGDDTDVLVGMLDRCADPLRATLVDVRALMQPAPEAAPDAPRTCKGEVAHHRYTSVLVTCGKPLPCPDHPATDALPFDAMACPECRGLTAHTRACPDHPDDGANEGDGR